MAEVAAECAATGTQRVCVTADVTVTPTAHCEGAEVVCLGDPVFVTPGRSPCPGGMPAEGGSCRFTVAQVLCVKVPVEFSAHGACAEAGVLCEEPGPTTCNPAPALPASADDFYEYLFPAYFPDEVLCRAVRTICARSSDVRVLLEDVWSVGPNDPCPAVFPLRCLDRLHELLAPNSPSRELVTTLLNQVL